MNKAKLCSKHNEMYLDWCGQCAKEVGHKCSPKKELKEPSPFKDCDKCGQKVLKEDPRSHICIPAEKLYEIIKGPQQSARHNDGKVQLREIDPAFITGLGEVLTASRAKYDEGNWMKETKFSTPYESAMRHLMKFWDGQELDEETTKHHLLHAATNLMFLYYHTRSGKGIDDRLFKKAAKKDS